LKNNRKNTCFVRAGSGSSSALDFVRIRHPHLLSAYFPSLSLTMAVTSISKVTFSACSHIGQAWRDVTESVIVTGITIILFMGSIFLSVSMRSILTVV
jgi:hypothetical protein